MVVTCEHEFKPINTAFCMDNKLSSPSYHQTGDGTKPLWCTQPSCRASRILLCQTDVLQKKKTAALIEFHGFVSKSASLLQLVINKTRQYLKDIFDGHMTKECTAKDMYCSRTDYTNFHFT
jgi:hypothetical protein